ncbi:MAG TPA: hypothetical protein VFJ07_18240 [Streptosporangiaceae bacterium]|nr:hypothetical protein [Streptosporangiaceae bacterium]
MPQRKQDRESALEEYRRKRDLEGRRAAREPRPEPVKSGKRIGELTQGKNT